MQKLWSNLTFDEWVADLRGPISFLVLDWSPVEANGCLAWRCNGRHFSSSPTAQAKIAALRLAWQSKAVSAPTIEPKRWCHQKENHPTKLGNKKFHFWWSNILYTNISLKLGNFDIVDRGWVIFPFKIDWSMIKVVLLSTAKYKWSASFDM